MDNVFSCILMAAITFPLSFFVARGCLKGVIRIGALRNGSAKPGPQATKS